MHAVIRTYTGDQELADQLAARADEVESVVSRVEGFRGYYLVRTEEGTTTITICDSESAADETTRRAAEWLREHASEIQSSPPQVTGGEVLIQLGERAIV